LLAPLAGHVTKAEDLETYAKMSDIYRRATASRYYETQSFGLDSPWKVVDPATTYTGANQFGASTTITKTNYTLASVFLVNGQKSVIDGKPGVISLPIKMEPDKAKQVKDKLRLIVVCKPTAPYLYDSVIRIKPTFDNPTDVTAHYVLLGAVASEFWVYNIETGEVYLRKKRI
jgi:hypothetical protein